ncbi:ATP-grasp domain-containing protein [Corynebacterium nasicanis]
MLRILQNIDDGGQSTVVVTDASQLSAAGHLAEHFELVPRIAHPDFIPRLLDICRTYQVNSVVPTIDTELEILASHKGRFAALGVDVLVSDPAVVELSSDKWKFNSWLMANGFPAIRTFEREGFSPDLLGGPVVAKPRGGSSSIGVHRAVSAEHLDLAGLGPEYIIQEQIEGVEVTIDFAVSRTGEFLGAVPRKRIEVRGGEVSKGVTVRHPALEEFVREFAATLPGAYGVLNVQVFLNEETGDFRVLELNARVGGGYPLSDAAGADFFRRLISGSEGPVDSWQENLLMLRFDDAVFVPDYQGENL